MPKYVVLPIYFQRSLADDNKGGVTESSERKMDRLETEFIDFPCKKLGGIAQVKTGYYFGKDCRFLAGFECEQAEDCGISRSPFSCTFNYTIQCPLYIALVNKLN